jgi:hypothetical protein
VTSPPFTGPAAEPLAVTVAVNVTFWPGFDGFGLPVPVARLMAVSAGVTSWFTWFEVLGLKLALPL